MEDNQEPLPNPTTSRNLIPISIIFAGILVAGAVIYATGSREVKNNPVTRSDSGSKLAVVLPGIDDDVILGNAKAPITIIEFGDFQCPYCEAFYKDTESKIRDQYIKTGKVRMVYRDIPLDKHPAAYPAALAAQCASDQGKYWAYHDALFDKQAQLETLDLVGLSKNLGMDDKIFKQCLDTGKYAQEVKKDFDDGVNAGVDATPYFFINGEVVRGAYPFEAFQEIIDKQLAKIK